MHTWVRALKMGRTSSKLMLKPKNPLQVLKWQETRCEIIKKKLSRKQKQLFKNQEKLNNKKKLRKRKTQTINYGRRNIKTSIKQFENIKVNETIANENYIAKKYENNFYRFVTNQIAFSTEFFANYERDIKQISDDLLCREHKINSNLEDHSVLFTDILQFPRFNTHSCSNNKKSLTTDEIPLQFQRIYIVFENIEISQPNEANYDCISTLCKVNMETIIFKEIYINWIMMMDSKYVDVQRILYEAKWQGYLRLKLLGQRQEETRSDDNTSSRSSGYITDTEYDYVYREFKPLDNFISGKDLPKSCVSNLQDFMEVNNKCPLYDESLEGKDEDKLKNRKTLSLNKLKEQQYLNSQHFMHYFGNLFRTQLAPKLHITNEELENSTYCSAAIYTRNYEIQPAIYVPQNAQTWPECAYKFKIRPRPAVRNYATGLKEQWPTRSMIKQIESFGCHLIPMGYAPKRQAHNPLRTLEWCIVFPKAERYLLQMLTRAQAKLLLMTQLLIKTYCKSLADHNILSFLRTHLFWTCERNFATWPEECMGDMLILFLKSFMKCLKQKRLNDFFIEQRNLFENIPDNVLSQLHSILSDILSNPLMHLLKALKKTNYVKNLYPQLNFSHIITLLTPKATNKMLKKFREIQLENQQWCKGRLKIDILEEEISLIIGNSSDTKEQYQNAIEEVRGAILHEVFLKQFLKMAIQALEYNSMNLAISLLGQARKFYVIYEACVCNKNVCDFASIIDLLEIQVPNSKAGHQHTVLPSTPTFNKNSNKINLNNYDNSDANLSYA